MTEYTVMSILLICILVYAIIKVSIMYVKEKKLKEVVAWCLTEGQTDFLYKNPLWWDVKYAQTNLNLLQKYRISTDEEWDMTKKVIKDFQKEVTKNYFSNRISLPTSKYVISDETYFMYLLHEYCMIHQYNNEFLGYDMYNKTISYNSNGMSGEALNNATYSLTDFAIVFHKLYYISFMHCKNSPIKKFNRANFINEHTIEKIIDSRQR